jgi:hypothetical protein
MNKSIIKYFDGTGTDDKGRTLNATLAWSDQKLESTHDYIQWWFPLDRRSSYNASAPIVDHETALEFVACMKCKTNLLKAYNRFHRFIMNDLPNRFYTLNHNWLRITRVITSLRLLGLHEQSGHFYNDVINLYKTHETMIDHNTLLHWADAAGKQLDV